MYKDIRKKPCRTRVLSMLGTLLSCIMAYSPAAEAMRAVYFIPKPAGDIFGDKVADFMGTVAADLGIDLEIVRVNTDSSLIRNRQTLETVQADKNNIDIVLLHYDTAILIPELSALAEKRDFVIATFNIKPARNDFEKIGRPREQYPRWITYLAPDDISAGYQLAHELIGAAKTLFADTDTMQMVAIGGNDIGEVNMNRLNGLRQRLQSESGVALKDSILTDWRREQGYDAAAKFIGEYPQTKIFWAASDSLALGAIDALAEKNLLPGRDFVIGGIDWSDEAIQAVSDGGMVATIGGHFMEGGWALLLAFDYLHGRDFADDIGVSIATPMHTLTRDNVAEYAELLNKEYWEQLDFRLFSKALNPDLKKYDFSLQALKQAKKNKNP